MRAHFAAVAERYDELRTPGDLVTPLIETLVAVADLGGRRVLDVGCGTGRLLQQLAAHFGAGGAGLDASEEMLAVARGNVPSGVELVRGEAERLPFGDASFERARFPDFEALAPELEAAGFAEPRCAEHVQPRRFSRETALRKLRERAASTFVLVSDDEYREGVARAEALLPDPVEYTLHLLIVTGDRP
jgi:SAM-dependent methyltransferase